MQAEHGPLRRLTRRGFTRLAAGAPTLAAGLAGPGFFATHGSTAPPAEGPSDKLNIAVIGIGGQGASNLKGVKSQNLVAFCDVDETRAAKSLAEFPDVRRFTDFRRMFDTLEKEIDAVVVSTPDHTHFHPA